MESFDDMIRRKLAEQPVPDFEEKYWLGAEKLLDEQDRKRRRGLMFWVWPLAGLLLVGVGFYIGFSVKNRDASIVEIYKDQPQIVDKNNKVDPSENNLKIDNNSHSFNDNKQQDLKKNQPLNPSKTQSETLNNFNEKAVENRVENSIALLKNRTKNRASESDNLANLDDFKQIVSVEKIGEDLGRNNPESTSNLSNVLGETPAQNIDDQVVEAIKKVFFILELLETRAGEQPFAFVRKVEKFPFYKTEIPPVLVAKKDKNRMQFGIQVAGFSSQKDNANKRVFGGQAGVFAQKKLDDRFVAQMFVDYKLIGGLNQDFNNESQIDSSLQYRFGLETISGEPIPVYFHHFVPGINLRYNFFGKQWAEIGFSERIWYGSHVEMNKVKKETFGSLSESKIKGYSNKNYGWNQFVPELRIGWVADLNKDLQLSVGYNRQIKTMGKFSASDTNGRYYSKNWFDLKLRYILY